MNRNSSNIPVIPLPNPGEGGPLPNPPMDNIPIIPLPNPGEGGPLPNPPTDNIPIFPLPNPGEGGPLPNPPWTPPSVSYPPIINGPSTPIWPMAERVRFLNAGYGYQPFRVFINSARVINFLSFASMSGYGRVPAGYQTVTVTGMNGYIYLQKSMPFYAGNNSTIAIIKTLSGLDLLQIPDSCCRPDNGQSNFRVSNLAYNSTPLDVLLGDGRVIYTDVSFKQTTPFKRIRPGAYQFFFAETNLMPIPHYQDIETLDSAFIGLYPSPNTVASLYLNVGRSATYTVFLLSNGPGPNDIQTLVIEDR